jgi:hypothetical protein
MQKSAMQRLIGFMRTGMFSAAIVSMLFSMLGAWKYYEYVRDQTERETQQSEAIEAKLAALAALRPLTSAKSALISAQDAMTKLDSFLAQEVTACEDFNATAGSSSSKSRLEPCSSLENEVNDYRALLYSVNSNVSGAVKDIDSFQAIQPERHSSTSVFSISAFAQVVSSPGPASPSTPLTPLGLSIESLRPMIMIGVIIAISTFFFICVGLFCLTTDADKLKFADNMIRTIVGFYIGIATGLLGLPVR